MGGNFQIDEAFAVVAITTGSFRSVAEGLGMSDNDANESLKRLQENLTYLKPYRFGGAL